MKQTLFFLFLVSIFSFGQTIPSGFQLVAYEGFDYSNGTNISNQGGGSGWSSNWVANYYGNSSMYVYSSGYSYSGLTTNRNRLEWGGSGFSTTSFHGPDLMASFFLNCQKRSLLMGFFPKSR